jgi:hypothetical protein
LALYARLVRFRTWSSLVQAASVVTAVGVGLGLLALLAGVQSDDLSSSMGATGLMTLALMALAGALVLWSIAGIQRLFRRDHRQASDEM